MANSKQVPTTPRSDEADCWLMVIGDTNAEILAKLDRPFFALSRSAVAQSIKPGDKCVLYRGRNAAGFIGIYEVTAPVSNVPTRVGVRTFGTKIAWRSLLLCEDNPVLLTPLVPQLSFIQNKQQYGAYFQTSLRRLDATDFLLIEKAVRAHAIALRNE
jgi:hypothetical protein